MAVNYKVYQSKRKGATMDKFYGRIAYRDTVNIKELAQNMQANCTVKHSDIVAVLTELSEAMKAELQRGNRVKIDGLGTFKIGLSTSPANTAKEFTAKNIKSAHVLFNPEVTIDASGQRVNSLVSGLKVKEASPYDDLKKAEDAQNLADDAQDVASSND